VIVSRSAKENEPLAGQTILVTRPEQKQDTLAALLQSEGATVLFQPTVAFRLPQSCDAMDAAWAKIESFDWLVFVSANGVSFFLNRFPKDLARLFSKKIAVIGPGTAAMLRNFGLEPHLIPQAHTAEGIVEALSSEVQAGKRLLIVRASRGRDVMRRQLSDGASDPGNICEIVAYESFDLENPNPEIMVLLKENRIDWTTCTSSAIATSLVSMFGSLLHRTKLLSMSPITSATIRKLGFEVTAESSVATMQGMFERLMAWLVYRNR